MTVAKNAPDLPPPPSSYTCPRCLGVVPGLVLVRYAIGMTDVGPVWVCDLCLMELEEVERATPTTIGGYIWGVTLEGATKGVTVALDRRLAERAERS